MAETGDAMATGEEVEEAVVSVETSPGAGNDPVVTRRKSLNAQALASGDTETWKKAMEDWLSEELFHQKQHLILLQNQVDTSKASNSQASQSLRKLIEQEKAQRMLAQRSAREAKELLADQFQSLAERIESLNERVANLETPWWRRFFSCFNCMGSYELSQYKAID